MSSAEHELLTLVEDLSSPQGFIGFMLFILSTYIILVLTYYVLRFSSLFPFVCRGSFLFMTYVNNRYFTYTRAIISILDDDPPHNAVGGDAIIKFYIIWMIIWEIVRFHVFFFI